METSLLSRGAWIEIVPPTFIVSLPLKSLLSRGAWIEIPSRVFRDKVGIVAPLTRSVD